MHINTSTLLNMLGSRVDNNIKQKIDDSSSGGKTDISAIVKDKTIQTVLSDTFKGLIHGGKDKSDILQTLKNSVQIFDLKSFSNDIKNIANTLRQSDNPKLQQQSIVLKEFFVNIKNLDENILKNNFANSGVMLESKLKDMASLLKEPALTGKIGLHKLFGELSLNIKAVLENGVNSSNIQNIKVTLNSLNQTLQSGDLHTNIKTAVSNLLNTINKIPLDETMQLPKAQLKEILPNIKNIEQWLLKDISKGITLTVLQKETGKLADTLKNITPQNIEKSVENIKNSIAKLETLNIKGDIKGVRDSVNTLLHDLKALIGTPKNLNQPQILDNIKTSFQNISQQIQNSFNEPVKQEGAPKLSNLINLLNKVPDPNAALDKLSLDQKELLPFLKQSNIVNSIELQKGIEDISRALNSISRSGISDMQIQSLQNSIALSSSSLAKADLQLEVKTAVSNLLNSAGQIAQNPKAQPPFQLLNTLVNNANAINNTLLNTPLNPGNKTVQVFLPDIAKDIKGVLLQVMEQLDKGDVSVSKELKAVVEKTLTQIEYFQVLSYTSSSNHAYLPFSWENIEEGDIKFSSDKKDNFSCQINLKLKEHGEIKILLELDKKNYLNINMGVGDKAFKSTIQQSLQVLRKGISNINLNLQSLNIFDLHNIDKAKNNPYNSGETLNFGLDVKV